MRCPLLGSFAGCGTWFAGAKNDANDNNDANDAGTTPSCIYCALGAMEQ